MSNPHSFGTFTQNPFHRPTDFQAQGFNQPQAMPQFPQHGTSYVHTTYSAQPVVNQTFQQITQNIFINMNPPSTNATTVPFQAENQSDVGA